MLYQKLKMGFFMKKSQPKLFKIIEYEINEFKHTYDYVLNVRSLHIYTVEKFKPFKLSCRIILLPPTPFLKMHLFYIRYHIHFAYQIPIYKFYSVLYT